MKAFIVSAVAILVRRLAERETWVYIEQLVTEADQMQDASGEAKRAWVVGHSIDAARWLINLIIEVIVAQKRV